MQLSPVPALVVASIPSPPISGFEIGPLHFSFYGILVALGVIAAWWLTKKRFVERGGSGDLVDKVLGRTVLFGFIGARLAYVSTHLSRFEGEWWKVIAVWEGGLALFGGLTAGALAIYYYTRKWEMSLSDFLDSLAPALPLGQAIGRWGNYFNQELFGTPTTLPWGLEIDPDNRPIAYPDAETFHPTFLYESLWNLALAGFIIWADRRFPSLKGRLIGVYLVGYGLMRFLLELIRTDTTYRFIGLSRNAWVSIGIVVIGTVVLLWRRARVESPDPA